MSQAQHNAQMMSKRTLVIVGLFTLIVILLYHVTFRWLFNQWMTDRVYSHGFIVPIISCYLVWIKRDQLASLHPRPQYILGGILLVTSCALLLLGRVGGIVQFEAASLLLLAPCIVILFWGWSHLRVLALPIVYLQFMVPWMDDIFNRVHIYFQLLSSVMGGWILKILGFSVYRDGIYLQLSRISLEVAPECSGVNFLVSVLAIGVPLVYLTQRTWLRGAGVLLSGVVITLFSNWVRVALAGIMGYYYGSEMLHGPGHILRGVLVAQVGWVELFVVNWLVCKIPTSVKYRLYERKVSCRWQPHDNAVYVTPVRSMVVLFISLAVFGIYLNLFAMPRPVPEMLQLRTLPYTLGTWKGYKADWFDGANYFPGVDSQLVRTYSNENGQSVHLYVGYMKSQDVNKRLISYHSKSLYDGSSEVATRLESPLPRTVNVASHNFHNQRYRVYFWYRVPPENITRRLSTKFKFMFNALLHRKNNGSVIILAVEEDNNMDDISSMPKYLVDYMERAVPVIYNYVY